MSVFTVRGATDTDIPSVKSIADICFPDPWSEASYASKLGNTVFSVAVTDGEIIGFAITSVAGDEAELYDIAVLPQYRGTGAATELLTSVKSEARLRGAEKIYLEVRSGNSRACAFYRKSGFSELGIRKNYYKNPTEDATLMSLDLN
jgi:ribosomal-protein-alanine N-acetyltransferase